MERRKERFLLFVSLFFIDFLGKILSKKLFLSKTIETNFLFTYHLNQNFLFFIPNNFLINLFLFFVLLILFSLSYQIYPLAWVFLLAGALSNLLSRFFCNGVIDYLALKTPFSYLYFNLADLYLIFGLFLFLKNKYAR